MQSWLKQARMASGLTVEQCALLLHRSVGSYELLEDHPGSITLDEIRALCVAFDKEARAILLSALAELAGNDCVSAR